MLGASVWGQSGTSLKDQGFHDLASEYGAQRTSFKPECIGTERAQMQLLLYSNTCFSVCKPVLVDTRSFVSQTDHYFVCFFSAVTDSEIILNVQNVL